ACALCFLPPPFVLHRLRQALCVFCSATSSVQPILCRRWYYSCCFTLPLCLFLCVFSSVVSQLVNVTAVMRGKNTPVFARRVARSADLRCCFSIITDTRSLDLEAESPELRDHWVNGLEFAVQRTKDVSGY